MWHRDSGLNLTNSPPVVPLGPLRGISKDPQWADLCLNKAGFIPYRALTVFGVLCGMRPQVDAPLYYMAEHFINFHQEIGSTLFYSPVSRAHTMYLL